MRWNERWKWRCGGVEQPAVRGTVFRQVQDAGVFSSCKVARYLEKTLYCWLEVKEEASSYAEETTSTPGEDCRLVYAPCKDQPVFGGLITRYLNGSIPAPPTAFRCNSPSACHHSDNNSWSYCWCIRLLFLLTVEMSCKVPQLNRNGRDGAVFLFLCAFFPFTQPLTRPVLC